MNTKTVAQRSSNGLIERLTDGTVATRGAVYTKPSATRIALVNAIIASGAERVEIELRTPGGGTRVVIGNLITAAWSETGTTRDVLVVTQPADLIPTVISLATVRSISELTLREYAQRVHA